MTRKSFWFSDHDIEADEDTCHVLLSTNEKLPVSIVTIQTQTISFENLLGIEIDPN